jgi:hypothetical protein
MVPPTTAATTTTEKPKMQPAFMRYNHTPFALLLNAARKKKEKENHSYTMNLKKSSATRSAKHARNSTNRRAPPPQSLEEKYIEKAERCSTDSFSDSPTTNSNKIKERNH